MTSSSTVEIWSVQDAVDIKELADVIPLVAKLLRTHEEREQSAKIRGYNEGYSDARDVFASAESEAGLEVLDDLEVWIETERKARIIE